jgi:flagellar biosynthesis protein FlhB
MNKQNATLFYKVLSFTIVAFAIYVVIVSKVSMWVDEAHYDTIKLLNTGTGILFLVILIIGILSLITYDLIFKRKK